MMNDDLYTVKMFGKVQSGMSILARRCDDTGSGHSAHGKTAAAATPARPTSPRHLVTTAAICTFVTLSFFYKCDSFKVT